LPVPKFCVIEKTPDNQKCLAEKNPYSKNSGLTLAKTIVFWIFISHITKSMKNIFRPTKHWENSVVSKDVKNHRATDASQVSSVRKIISLTKETEYVTIITSLTCTDPRKEKCMCR
jgi:hypothetical protein